MPSRSDDAVGHALDAAASLIVEDVRAGSSEVPVVLIDGRSGAGKTSLAQRVAALWPIAGSVQVIAMDSIYPGWDGLDAGVEHAVDAVLRPHRAGAVGEWRGWDWSNGVPAGRSTVDPATSVILEGSGILNSESAGLATVRVWVESDDASRRDRALARDGDTYRPHWERWAAQEQRHIERDDPRSLATRVVSVP